MPESTIGDADPLPGDAGIAPMPSRPGVPARTLVGARRLFDTDIDVRTRGSPER